MAGNGNGQGPFGRMRAWGRMSWAERARRNRDPSRFLNDVFVNPSVGPFSGWLIGGLLGLVVFLTVEYAPGAVERAAGEAGAEEGVIPVWAGYLAIGGVAVFALFFGWEPIFMPRLARLWRLWRPEQLLPMLGPGSLQGFLEAIAGTCRLIWHLPSWILSLVDYLLARPVAIIAGTKVGEWLPVPWQEHSAWPRYFLILAWLAGMSYLAYWLPAPAGLYAVLWGVVLVFGVARRWNWVERDREAFLAARKADDDVQRIGFGEDLRDEALTAIVFLFVLTPLGLRQVYLATCTGAADGCAFDISGLAAGQDPGFLAWLGFFGAELVKAVPFVDWSEVFSVANGSPINAHTARGAQVIFFVRAALDLVLLAAVLQAIQLASRTRAQSTAFWSGTVPILDPFAERPAFRRVLTVKRQYPFLTLAQASEGAGFPDRYEPDRLRDIIQGVRGRERASSKVLTDSEARCGALAVLARQDEDAALALIGNGLVAGRDDTVAQTALAIALDMTTPHVIPVLDRLLIDDRQSDRRADIERALAWHRGETRPDAVPYGEMVRIEPGSFLMGATESERQDWGYKFQTPQRHVEIEQAFEIGKYPVTFAEYDAFCEATGRDKPDDRNWGRERRPVINVTWHDAHAYCQWLNERTGERFRLPTEAEWEYACRAGTTTPFSFGETLTTDQANYDGNYPYPRGKKGIYRRQTTPVDSFPANPWGLHDMHGNVWEWCFDPWHWDYKEAPPTAAAWIKGGFLPGAVLRGGSWGYSAVGCRSAVRGGLIRGGWIDSIGVRLARTLRR